MKKEGVLLVFLLAIMSINFVGARFHYGGYSLSDLLSTFDSSTVILTAIFIIAFGLIFWSLSKFFRENTTIAGVISFAISFLLIFEINRRGYDFTGFFYNIGISEGILSIIIPLVLIVGLIFSGFKYGWGITLTSIGGFFIIISFTSIIYEKGITFILGFILLSIGIWLWIRRRKRGFGGYDYQNYDTSYGPSPRQIYKQQRAQQKYQQKLENQSAEQKRQARETEIRRRAGKIAKIRTRREKAEQASQKERNRR